MTLLLYTRTIDSKRNEIEAHRVGKQTRCFTRVRFIGFKRKICRPRRKTDSSRYNVMFVDRRRTAVYTSTFCFYVNESDVDRINYSPPR